MKNNYYNSLFSAMTEYNNPSVKVLYKDFVFQTYHETLEAFHMLKPVEKVKYHHLYATFVCAKEDSKSDYNEWTPNNETPEYDWINEMIKQRNVLNEEIQQTNEEQAKRGVEAFKSAIELEGWKKEFYEASAELKERMLSEEFIREFIRYIGPKEFWDTINNGCINMALQQMQKKGFFLPKEVTFGERKIKPEEYNPGVIPQYTETALAEEINEEQEESTLNSSTLDNSEHHFSVSGASSATLSAGEAPSLNPSTLDNTAPSTPPSSTSVANNQFTIQ